MLEMQEMDNIEYALDLVNSLRDTMSSMHTESKSDMIDSSVLDVFELVLTEVSVRLKSTLEIE